MSATQVEIAKEVGLDVSSVNKILNGTPGPVFKKETIDRVKKTAKRMGYNFERASKGKLFATLSELFPASIDAQILATARGVSLEKVLSIRRLISRTGGAAIILLVLQILLS